MTLSSLLWLEAGNISIASSTTVPTVMWGGTRSLKYSTQHTFPALPGRSKVGMIVLRVHGCGLGLYTQKAITEVKDVTPAHQGINPLLTLRGPTPSVVNDAAEAHLREPHVPMVASFPPVQLQNPKSGVDLLARNRSRKLIRALTSIRS